MNATIRPGRPDDAEPCGQICYEAFKTLAEHHRFPPDFPSPEVATGLLAHLLAHPKFHAVIAELDGRVVGSNFVDERGTIAGIGPITVDPTAQNHAVGRQLMTNVLQHVADGPFAGSRLVQAAYHNRSLSLYAKLGFVVREPLSTMQGTPPAVEIPGRTVRPAKSDHLAACNALCTAIHGHDRSRELQDAIEAGSAMVVEHGGRITGYATSISFLGHAVGESNDDLKAMLGATKSIEGPGFLLPGRNADLFHWCLQHGLRVVQPMTLMSTGLYNEPAGAFLPSILF
ncbi:MAG: GNAT family N-acetyltransferase [Akkermansiaceae bacterium]|nr:GNAT family N-acetyltransferase [Akkermansiaceae bacterium]